MYLNIVYLISFLYSPFLTFFGTAGLVPPLFCFSLIIYDLLSNANFSFLNRNLLATALTFFAFSGIAYFINYDEYSFNYFGFLCSWFPLSLILCTTFISRLILLRHLKAFFFVVLFSTFVSIFQILLGFISPSIVIQLMPWGAGANTRLFSLFTEPALYSTLVFIAIILLASLLLNNRYSQLRTDLFPKWSDQYLYIFLFLQLILGLITASAGFFVSIIVISFVSFVGYFRFFLFRRSFKYSYKLHWSSIFVYVFVILSSLFLFFNLQLVSRLIGFLQYDSSLFLGLLDVNSTLTARLSSNNGYLYSSDLRVLAPVILFFSSLQYPLGYSVIESTAPMVVFFRDFTNYFYMALNLWELLFRSFGYSVFLLLFILFKRLPFILLLSLILVGSIDGALLKPSLPLYFLVTYLFSSYPVSLHSNAHTQSS